jgi:integrase
VPSEFTAIILLFILLSSTLTASQSKELTPMHPIKKSSIRIYENKNKVRNFRIFLNFVQKDSIKLVDIEEYLHHLKNRKNKNNKPLSISTIQSHIYGISSKLKRHLIATGRMRDIGELVYFIKNLPIGKNSINQKVSVLSKKDIHKLISLSPADISVILKTYYLTGCRFQELLDIELKHVVKIKREAMFIIHGKNRKIRSVFIPYKLFKEIKSITQPEKFLFENSFKRKYKQRNLSKKIEKISLRILNKKVTMHMLRKGFATHIYKTFPYLKALADYLGNTPEILAKHYLRSELKSSKIYETLLTNTDKDKYL